MATTKRHAAPDPDRQAMLEAHVAFEVARWTGDALGASVREEADALHAWLATVTLAEIAPAEETARALAAATDGLRVTDELVGLVADVLLGLRATLLDSSIAGSELLSRRDLDGLVELIAGMEELRGQVIGAVTENSAYHKLVAHVLYYGIKGYVLTENVLARKLPGAQSLIKLGQRSLNSAAPGFEEAMDRQLSAFVQANIGETLRDSRRFLDLILTEDTMHELVDELWTQVAERPAAELAAALDEGDLESMVVLAAPITRAVVESGQLAPLVEGVAARVLEQYADCEVAALLLDLGFRPEPMVDRLVAVAAPAVAHAHETGFLEERIRARLAAFYDLDPAAGPGAGSGPGPA